MKTHLTTGLPVIGMLNEEGARVLQELGAGLVCPAGDGAALADRVMQVASMPPDERAATGAQRLEYSPQELDRRRLLTQSEEWMGELASGDGVASAS